MLQNITFSTQKIGRMVMCRSEPNTEKTPDDWIRYTEYLVEKAQEDVKKGINLTHIFQEFILMGYSWAKGIHPSKRMKLWKLGSERGNLNCYKRVRK